MGGDDRIPSPPPSFDRAGVGRANPCNLSAGVAGRCPEDELETADEGKEIGALGPTEVPKVSVGRAPPQRVVDLISLTRLLLFPLLPFFLGLSESACGQSPMGWLRELQREQR